MGGLVALAVRVAVQDPGGILTGSATDAGEMWGTGPVLIRLALAPWPAVPADRFGHRPV
jgi:hypothetical protein